MSQKRAKRLITQCLETKHSRGADCGSGTMLGIGLVTAICSILVLCAVIGTILVSKHRAYALANASAISGAVAIQNMYGDACKIAQNTATANNAKIESCVEKDNDVSLKLSVPLHVPMASRITVSAKAGLVDCSE
ncbi:Rv3654c family TadE-like protein [Gardnerella piotii]|uniref:Rv3654c family TadE-like protein n=1 Tax=Gardnerella piotii TaxID=2792977 RepID=UPI0039EE0DA8